MALGKLIGIAVVKQRLGIQKLYEIPVQDLYLFQPGDEVIYESTADPDEVEKGEVVCVGSTLEGSDFLDFVLAEHHEALPLRRLISKIEYVEMRYRDDDSEEE